jgi:hypothetical protein
MNRVFCLAALLLMPVAALALDASDVGVYAVVHRDGHVTAKAFRVLQVEGRWQVEDRKPDGTWENVTCEADCVLEDSTAADVERFLGKLMAGELAGCVHNKSFAFCRVTDDSHPGERQYLLVALTQEQPVVLRLAPQGNTMGLHRDAAANTDNQKQVDGFGGWIIVTPDEDWEQKWNTPSSTTPYFSTAKDVKRGKTIFVLTFFANPKLNGEGKADITCDIEVVRPDGSFSTRETGTVCFNGMLEDVNNMYLSHQVIGFIGESKDLPGEWVVRVTLKDNVRKVAVPLKTSFVLVDD